MHSLALIGGLWHRPASHFTRSSNGCQTRAGEKFWQHDGIRLTTCYQRCALTPINLQTFIIIAIFQAGNNLDHASCIGQCATTRRPVIDLAAFQIVPATNIFGVIGIQQENAECERIDRPQIAGKLGALLFAQRSIGTNAPAHQEWQDVGRGRYIRFTFGNILN